MDGTSFSQLIANLGFPIAVCCVLFWYIVKKDEKHEQEMEKMSTAINNNTRVMEKVLAKLGDEND